MSAPTPTSTGDSTQIERLAELKSREDWSGVLAGVKQIKPDLEDPVLKGWAVFFEYEALYSLGKNREALSLFFETVGNSPDDEINFEERAPPVLSDEEIKRTFLITDKNVAWMYSVAQS